MTAMTNEVTVEDTMPCGTDAETLRQTNQKLQALRPTPLLPCRVVKRRMEAVLALKQIETLHVTKSLDDPDQMAYCIDMYYHETQSRIPVHRQYGPTKKRARGQPNIRLHVAFDDFLQLSTDAYELTRRRHVGDSCAFCHHVIFYNTTSDLKPRWNTHWFKNEKEVSDMLTAYLKVLLNHVVDVPTSGGSLCHGQERIPRLLQVFLAVCPPRM